MMYTRYGLKITEISNNYLYLSLAALHDQWGTPETPGYSVEAWPVALPPKKLNSKPPSLTG